jgi:hypothetical protein
MSWWRVATPIEVEQARGAFCACHRLQQQTIPPCRTHWQSMALSSVTVCTIQVGRVRNLLSYTQLWNGKNRLKTTYSECLPRPKISFRMKVTHSYTTCTIPIPMEDLTFKGYIEVPNASNATFHEKARGKQGFQRPLTRW